MGSLLFFVFVVKRIYAIVCKWRPRFKYSLPALSVRSFSINCIRLTYLRMDKCGHMFCRICISYYMTEQKTIQCAFCLTVVSRVIQISAHAEAPHESKPSGKSCLASKAKEHPLEPDALHEEYDTTRALQAFGTLLDGTFDVNMIENVIQRPFKGKLLGESAVLQLLLGHAISQPALISELPLGKLIHRALTERNRDAWRLLVPLYEVVNHEGLEIAQTSGTNILDTVEELGMSEELSLNHAVLTLGVPKTTLLIKLGIFEVEMNPGHIRSVASRGKTSELELLLSFRADPVAADTDGETALHCASTAEIAELLCNAGAPIAALDGDRNTTIAKAAAYKRNGVLEVLLKQPGAKDVLDQHNKFGKAAVHYAKNKPDTLALLLEAGANPNIEIGPKDPGL